MNCGGMTPWTIRMGIKNTSENILKGFLTFAARAGNSLEISRPMHNGTPRMTTAVFKFSRSIKNGKPANVFMPHSLSGFLLIFNHTNYQLKEFHKNPNFSITHPSNMVYWGGVLRKTYKLCRYMNIVVRIAVRPLSKS